VELLDQRLDALEAQLVAEPVGQLEPDRRAVDVAVEVQEIGLDPHRVQEADIEVPLWNFGLLDNGTLLVEDLMRGSRFAWTGKIQRVRLKPEPNQTIISESR